MLRSVKWITLLMAMVLVLSAVGVRATWDYAEITPDFESMPFVIEMEDFEYTPAMPEGEVTLLERIYALLNNLYSNHVIGEDEGREYLLTTLDKDWSAGLNPLVGSFAGSMDPTVESKYRMDVMFGDIIDFSDPDHVSFILKSEDLVGSIDNEIALYSTSDPLCWAPGQWMNHVVGVYLSVFIPILDDQGVTVGYELLCDSIHGYCMEVQYMDGDLTPSFSTDHWRDTLFYWHENYLYVQPIEGEDRYKYECYHPADGNYAYPGRTVSWQGWIEVPTNQWASGEHVGKRASQRLEEILAARS